ncbi:MAG TPA: DNA primase [Cyclobacteriaceae bacterium]|nr:DNA primase [Cyclobacteriaceae bacterium]
MISRETIDEVKSRVDVVDVIGDFVTLKRSGQNYKALSPFTNEKTPSFYVVPAKGIFKDFSSGKGGDAITFIMEHEGFSYVEAIRYLAQKYGVEIKEEATTTTQDDGRNERDSLYILMGFARETYTDLLFNHEEGRAVALSYFRERGFSDPVIRKFELGYSLQAWDHFCNLALAKGFSREMLEKAGLMVAKEGGRQYDRFRGRVIFPIHNLSGKVIAFGARILGKHKDQPKYVNSPETAIYHKSQVLYGLHQARQAIRRDGFCYLVEGYTDVLSLVQADIENVVASSGTALTEEQIRLVSRFTKDITVLFDGDAAGIKAAIRGIDMVLKEGLNVRVVLLPEGEDPDSYSKKLGSTAFRQYLKEQEQDFISFKISLLRSEAANDPIRRAEAIKETVTSIAVIPDPIQRSVYVRQAAVLFDIEEQVLIHELNKVLISERQKKRQEAAREEREPLEALEVEQPQVGITVADMVQLQEREVVRLLLNYADSKLEEDVDLLSYFISEFEDLEFTHEGYGFIFSEFEKARHRGELIDSQYFMVNASESIKRLVTDLTLQRYHVSPHWRDKYHIYFENEEEKLYDSAHQNVLRRKYRYVQNLLEQNTEKIKEAEARGDHAVVDELIEVQMRLKNADQSLAGELGIVSGKY